ncbi:hypothetical protein TIFTF001_023029 [Ficus carica]|uniref:Uncharacterized protein n=1 Tax=Ficus carica TaxID=3494 RepID=A0AA88AJP2_FICCA|nr:hypothetical protein TIFTF001_023029 [Ficus carica]
MVMLSGAMPMGESSNVDSSRCRHHELSVTSTKDYIDNSKEKFGGIRVLQPPCELVYSVRVFFAVGDEILVAGVGLRASPILWDSDQLIDVEYVENVNSSSKGRLVLAQGRRISFSLMKFERVLNKSPKFTLEVQSQIVKFQAANFAPTTPRVTARTHSASAVVTMSTPKVKKEFMSHDKVMERITKPSAPKGKAKRGEAAPYELLPADMVFLYKDLEMFLLLDQGCLAKLIWTYSRTLLILLTLVMLMLRNVQRGLLLTYLYAQLKNNQVKKNLEIIGLREKLATKEKALKELKKKLVDNKSSSKVLSQQIHQLEEEANDEEEPKQVDGKAAGASGLLKEDAVDSTPEVKPKNCQVDEPESDK